MLIASSGLGWEAVRFGPNIAATERRLEAEVNTRVADQAREVERLARRVAAETAVIAEAGALGDQRPALFGRLSEGSDPVDNQISATIYAPPAGGAANHDVLAWSAGPAEDVAGDRLAGREALFVAPGTAGHRLVFVLPVESAGRRLAIVAAETALSRVTPGGKVIETSFGPVTAIAQYEGAGAGPAPPDGFVIEIDAGAPLLEVHFAASELATRRSTFRRRVLGIAGVPLAGALLLAAPPVLARRRRTRRLRAWLAWSVLVLAIVGLSTWGLAALLTLVGAPAAVVECALAGVALGAAAIFAGALWRREHRREPRARPIGYAAEHLAAGLLLAAAILALASYLSARITPASLDRWQISLFPVDVRGLLYPGSVLLMELALCWTAVSALALAHLRWRITSSRALATGTVGLWLVPTGLLLVVPEIVPDMPRVPVLPALGVALVAIAVARRAPWLRRYYRRTTQAARLLLGFGALLAPLVVVYPMAAAIAAATARDVIEREYGPAAAGHQAAVRAALAQAQREIDQLPRLHGSPIDPSPVDTQAAFDVWKQTSLSRTRVAADVELYARDRRLVSRFALNLPQYFYPVNSEVWDGTSCAWEVHGEVARFGAVNRLLLRAERALCGEGGTLLGAVVVHVAQDDYAALPFVSSDNPYVEVLGGGGTQPEGTHPTGLEVVVYGWSLQPLFTSGRVAWLISGDVFGLIYESGTPFWTVLEKDGRTYHVYFTQNRSGIYALGYPTPTLFEHTTRLAEITALTALLFVLVQVGAALFGPLAGRRDGPVRVLFREIRTSFYRKLFLYFVLVAIGPVVVFALLFGAYMTAQLRAEVEAEASGVVTVARRVFEELAAARQHPDQPQPPPSDDEMVWIRQVINQDVNFFEGAELVASSQRDLFASGLLPTRTPAAVYRAIVVDRLPTVVMEYRLGGLPHLVAATHVVSHGQDAVLSVPLAPRQREIEREIDDLNRGVLVGAVFVVLFAAGLGASVARRVSDPVARLSKATRQIAEGRLDVQIVADTADELRRLIDDFNRMTATLRAQRAALARTNQLKAWNEMARQVAHEIKNPLTPIQLAAEHLQRVHADQGAPLGSVFDQCLRTILDQVRLLRQIASEFATFSGELTARPEALSLAEVVESVIAPYRLGLVGRVRFDLVFPPDLAAVRADRTLLTRALTNLVENAIQAMPAGGALRAAAEVSDRWVVLRVIDTGVGMETSAVERAFEPYFSTKTGGSGLGLANAKRNIELGGGAIVLTSAPGVGTTVTLTLPRADLPDGGGTESTPPR